MTCLGAGISSLVRRSRWGLVRAVTCWNMPAGPGKVPRWRRASSRRGGGPGGGVGPGGAGLGLDDADEQQGEPAEDDVGADAFFEPVVDRPQVDDLFHVSPAAFDLQELLVAQGDVLGGQVRVGAAQQVLAVQVL